MAKENNKKKDIKDTKKKKKSNSHLMGKKEFIFDFISLVFALSVALYYGGRCFYYYSLQHQGKKNNSISLYDSIMDNNILVKTGDGFHKEKEGYYFKGNITNNYVWFGNRMFRVLSVDDEDKSVKLVSNDLVSIFMWGEEDSYEKSNIRLWLTNTGEDHTGLYYNTLPNQEKFIKKTNYKIDKLSDKTIDYGKEKYSDNVVSLTLDDYIKSGGKSGFLNNGKMYYLLGFNSDNENIYVEEDGSIMTCDKLDGYGVRAVITLRKKVMVTQGDGTESNPYMLDQGEDTNYVDSYVKLGDDMWKVMSENNGILKMYLNGYITIGGAEVVKPYSNKGNMFDYSTRGNIAQYLLNEYYNNLSYKDIIVNNNYPLGEVSDEVGHRYLNIYSNGFDGPISMLNIFDYVSNNELSDFFRNNVTSSIGNIQYVSYENGILEESDITEQKHIVPVISIDSKSIKSGNGRMDNPYMG